MNGKLIHSATTKSWFCGSLRLKGRHINFPLVVALVIWLSCGSSKAKGEPRAPYCLPDDDNPYLKFATKTAYNFSRGAFPPDVLVPEGCEAVQIWHLVRHGTRYPSKKDITAFVKFLPELQRRIGKADNELCTAAQKLLMDWSLRDLNVTWNSILSPAGELELLELATRYKAAIPNLLDQPFSNDTFKFRHTKAQRTEASARAYAKGLFGEAGNSIYIPPALDPDPLIKFYEVCSKYIREVDENPEATVEAKLFTDSPEMKSVVAEVSKCLGFNVTFDEVELMYDACRFYKAWSPSNTSVWCAVFTPENLKILEYWQDLEYFYEDGYGHPINYESACPPVQDLIQHFSKTVAERPGPSGIFYFTHSGTLIKVMARLGLYKDTMPLTHNTMDSQRLWRTSRHGIFATNIAFTLSKCGKANMNWWITLMVNEIPVHLPGCPSEEGCSWQDFLLHYGQFEHCDFNAICENNKEVNSSTKAPENWWSYLLPKLEMIWGYVSLIWN